MPDDQERLNKYDAMIRDMSDQLSTHRSSVADLVQTISDYNSQLAYHQKMADGLKQNITDSSGQLEFHKKSVFNLTTGISELESEKRALQFSLMTKRRGAP